MSRPNARILAAVLLALPLGLRAAPGADADEGRPPANWTAPPYWIPPQAERDGDTGGAAGRESLAVRSPLVPGPTALPFFALPPCRLVDTRGNAPLTGGFLPAATIRSYTLTGVCNVPATAKAVSLNATVVNATGPGFLVLFPQGGTFPPVSTLNFLGGDVVVNAAVVPLSATGGISIALGVSGGDVILDTNGYYAVAPSVTSLNTQIGDLVLSAGTNVTITPTAGGLTIAAPVSATSLTGILPVANGGTGASTPATSVYQARVTGGCGASSGGISTIGAAGNVTCLPAPAVTSASFGANVKSNVNPGVQTGNQSAITITRDGLPLVAYYDGALGSVRVMKCFDPACLSGGIQTVPSPGGSTLSAATGADGLGIVSFFDATNKSLKVAKCVDLECFSPTVTTVVPGSVGNVNGLDNSIFVPPDGLPLISYSQSTLGRLGLVKCGNAACSASNQLTSFATIGANLGSFTSIAAGADSLPYISHYDSTNLNLLLLHCTTMPCTSTLTATPDTTGDVGQETSLAISSDGLPVVSYRDVTNGWLKVMKCLTPGCGPANVSVTAVDQTASAGFGSSIAIGADGNPVVSYTAGTPNAALKVLRCGNPACSSGNVISIVDSSSNFEATSITIAPDGLPVISYHDQTSTQLRIVKCGNEACAPSIRRR